MPQDVQQLLAPPRPPPPSGPAPTLTHPQMMSLILKLIIVSVPTLKPPLPPQIPPEEETPMEDVGQNDPLQLSNSTRAALDQLLSQIDQATSTVETHLTADSYAALAALPLSYPWSCLVLDLKELLPILDRYVLSCIIASHATLYTDLTHDQTLFPLLRALAQNIVNIISPQASLNTRPVLPKEIYKVEFWHAHLNYACLRASDAGLPGGGAARLAGDQLCHWNTLSPDAVFQATHLIVFLPPAPLSSLTTPVITPRSSNFLPLTRPQMRAPQPVSNKSPTFPCPPYSPTNLTPSLEPVQRLRKVTSLPLPSLYLLNLKHLFNQRALIGFYAFPCHPPILAPTDASPPLHPTIMAPAHLKPLTLLSVMLPIFHTMTHLLHTLTQLPLCNSQTQPLGLETSDAPRQNPPLLLHRISKAGYSQAPFDCTPRLSINFLGPISLISPPPLESHFFGHISLDQLIPLLSSHPILRPCRPPSSNLEHLNALKLRLLRSHANPLHVVPLPLQLHRIPCHHIPNRPLLSLTLQVSRSLLLILPPPPPTLSPLHSPLSLILKYWYLTPLLVVAPLDGTRIPFFQHSYPKAIPLGYNKLVLHLWVPPALLPSVLQGSLLTQPLTHSSRWIFETSILSTQTLPKAKVKARVNQLTKVKARAKKDKVKDKAKEKANLKAKKNVLPPLLLPYMPQQPKGKARNSSTPHPPPIPFSVARLVIVAGPASLPLHHLPSICSPTWPGLSLWQVPPFDQLPQFISIPSLYPTISHSHL